MTAPETSQQALFSMPPPSPPQFRNLRLPLLVGLLSLALTGWLWHHENQAAEARMRADFDFSVRQSVSRIEERIASYEQLLRAARGLFEASDAVSREDFQSFVNALMGGSAASGVQLMAFTPLLPAGQLPGHVATRRALGDPDYTIRPDHDGGPVAPVTYIAPLTPGNRAALGHNIYTDPLRRKAMLQARDSGGIAITSRIALRLDAPHDRPAFAMYLALYNRGQPGDTPAGRQAAVYGWVHIAFQLADLIASIPGEGSPGIALRIYDGPEAVAERLMFDSEPWAAGPLPRFTAIKHIEFPQHRWALQVRSTPAFELGQSNKPARIIAGAGIGVSLLLALFTWQLVTGRARAFAQAQAMTRELREREEYMRHMAQHDPLTQLPNRALFSDRLQAALARARRERSRAALMFVDLDHFKPVNDACGHAVGDSLLIAATERMRECLRESDTLARVGGDEFVVLLPHIDSRDDARQVAERIRASIALPFQIGPHQIDISASIGICIFPEHAGDEVGLMKCADTAMYQAKDAGRDRLFFADEA